MKKITKNTIILHSKCSRLGFLGEKIEDERSFFIDQGIAVNDRAIEFFGADSVVQFDRNLSYDKGILAAAEESKALLGQGQLVAEATFATEHTVVRCDLAKKVKGKLNFIEVKSSKTDDAKKIERHYNDYLMDIAAQCVLLQDAGVKVGSASLALLNHEAVGPDAKNLFTVYDVSDHIKPFMAEIDLAQIIKERQEKEIPQQDFCKSCRGCSHFSMCWPMYPEKHATIHLPRIQFPKLKDCHENKIYSGVDLDPTNLTEKQQLAHTSWVKQKPVLHKEIFKPYHEKMYKKSRRVYLLDFEVARPALPLYDDHHPYTQLPFQYSLHTAEFGKDKQLKLIEHKEFLHTAQTKPTEFFIRNLLRDLNEADYPIVVYSPYEQSVLRDVCNQHPKYTKRINKIIERFVDIHEAISNSFSHPDMNGRTSIKLVLPALSPNFSYADLTINNGVKAFESWLKIRVNHDPKLEKDMLAYCERDTEAMFHVMNGIYSVYHDRKLEKPAPAGDRDISF